MLPSHKIKMAVYYVKNKHFQRHLEFSGLLQKKSCFLAKKHDFLARKSAILNFSAIFFIKDEQLAKFKQS
jgi:hypothetical protein